MNWQICLEMWQALGVCRLPACILISGPSYPERAREWASIAFMHDVAMVLLPHADSRLSSPGNTATVILRSTSVRGPLKRRWPCLTTGQSSKRPSSPPPLRVPASGSVAREAQSMCSLSGRQARERSKPSKENACICKSDSLTKVACNPLKTPPMRSHLTTFGMRSQIGTSWPNSWGSRHPERPLLNIFPFSCALCSTTWVGDTGRQSEPLRGKRETGHVKC
ncbi:hypothetical protein V8C35DRAFT_125916 [Trichoderma chlorosporum]